jgi:site-specific DNA-methyltransferase (adenine-specific)
MLRRRDQRGIAEETGERELSDITWTNITVKLGDLKPWADNPRQSSKAQAKRILASFEKFGQVAPIAVGPNFEVYDGHQRLSALLTIHGAGFEVDARQSSKMLADDERRALVLALANATGSWDWNALSGWNTDTLTDWGFDKDTLNVWNNDANNLKEMLKSEQPSADAEPETDRAAELLEKWGVEFGQLWQIGEHRLICGDCTDAATVARVMGGESAVCMWTDPPYGVEYVGKTKDALTIENDGADDLPQLLAGSYSAANSVLVDGAPIYVAHPAGALQFVFGKAFLDVGWKFHEEIVWVKDSMVLGHSDYHLQHEGIHYGWKASNRFWYGERNQVSVLPIDRPKRSEEHPTMKPPALVEKCLHNSTQSGDMVYEPFSGSGTTLVACENLHRRCRAVEISPAYCSVALERMATAFPALEIKRVE